MFLRFFFIAWMFFIRLILRGIIDRWRSWQYDMDVQHTIKLDVSKGETILYGNENEQ